MTLQEVLDVSRNGMNYAVKAGLYPMLMSDGAKEVCEAAGCYWLMDILGTTGVNLNSVHSAKFGSLHAGGAHFVFGDGHVQFISENIESTPGITFGPTMGTYQRLGHIHDGQPVGEF